MTQMSMMASPQDFDPDYHWNFVRFTAQGRRFCVPDYLFIEGSDYFAAEYGLKSGSGTPTDIEVVDASTDKVVELDVSIEDFRSFLTVLYPKTPDAIAQISEEGWLSILRLSTKWYFNDLRKMAIDKLEDYVTRMGPIELIGLAKELSFAPWLAYGYKDIVTRPQSVTVEVAREVGWEIAIQLCAMREERRIPIPVPPPTDPDIEFMLSQVFAPINLRQSDFITSAERVEAERLAAEREAAVEEEKRRKEEAVESQKKERRYREAEEAERVKQIQEASGLERRRRELLDQAEALGDQIANHEYRERGRCDSQISIYEPERTPGLYDQSELRAKTNTQQFQRMRPEEATAEEKERRERRAGAESQRMKREILEREEARNCAEAEAKELAEEKRRRDAEEKARKCAEEEAKRLAEEEWRRAAKERESMERERRRRR
ncbi:hypothetical protein FA15DRAFT_459099 [Coprinopsis marcescibilis]|uniref:BTB domain-containing protein n=1 Tax=Coprinopsis marcescibilis TaxID=230819 RepID=A0A5C3KT35_COPMA|nr:hypothetical protein FA15DRAFT_459099 [Coprinopsis marcescibilis]